MALKWFLPAETGSAQALDLLKNFTENKYSLWVPNLFASEVSNGLLMAARRGRIDPLFVLEAILDLHSLGIADSPVQHDEVLALAFRTGLTIYDAAHLWLAMERKNPLFTADGKLYKISRQVFSKMMWIEDWKIGQPPRPRL